ncbi:MAG: DUF2252 family protein [Bryobacteraceae bacterium]
MGIRKATANYEAWLRRQLTIVEADRELKHQRMAEGPFPFLRATFYRWAQLWPKLCKDLAAAPSCLAVGDLHVENFGTWRDAEGRLIWGINDFDEAWPLAYTNDLVRLAASALLAAGGGRLAIDAKRSAEAILKGYHAALQAGGRAFVLAEHHPALRDMARQRLKDPEAFWEKLDATPAIKRPPPDSAMRGLRRLLPEPDLPLRIVHRIAGLGSLGRQRFVAIADWRGGRIAREAKAMAPSAWVWDSRKTPKRILYQKIIDQSVRCPDPYVKLKGRWIVRRLSPDCGRIELSDLPAQRDEVRLLAAMGFETANVHIGAGQAREIGRHLAKLPPGWLTGAAGRMAEAVIAEWKSWREAE